MTRAARVAQARPGDERPAGGADEVRAKPVPSPCISVCRIEPASGLCEGCLRTLDEIALWGSMDDELRRDVWKAIEARRAQRDARADAAHDAGGARNVERRT